MSMKIVVIGGTALIGSKVVEKLKAHGYEAVAARPIWGSMHSRNLDIKGRKRK